jgi:hypothetical protein
MCNDIQISDTQHKNTIHNYNQLKNILFKDSLFNKTQNIDPLYNDILTFCTLGKTTLC